ncbi:MAG: FlgD immunoglobulin-like domain containing protein, partial [bacterium]
IRHTYGSFAKVKLSKPLLTLSFLIAGTCCLVGGAGAGDYDLSLHIYPNPFLAGHFYETPSVTYAKVAFKVPSEGTASIYIYDFEGNRVRALFEGSSYSPGKHDEEWDGRDDRGNLVAPGPYVIVLELTIQGELYRDTFVAVANR